MEAVFERVGWEPVRLRTLVARSWAARAFLAGGLGASVDLALVGTLVHFGGMQPMLATAIGVVVGGAINFGAQKYLAFRDRDRNVGLQVLRYVSGYGLAFVLFEAVNFAVRDRQRDAFQDRLAGDRGVEVVDLEH